MRSAGLEPEARGDGVVQLHEDDDGDAQPGAEEAERGSGGVERLGDEDAAADASADDLGRIGLDEAGAGGVGPTEIEHDAGDEDVEPVEAEGEAVSDELRQQARGERHEGDGEEKAEVDPGEVAGALADVIELGLLAGPEDAEGEKAHAVGHPLWAECAEGGGKFAFAVNLRGGGDVEVEDEERHGHGKDAIAEGCEALEIAALDAVVEGGHGSLAGVAAKLVEMRGAGQMRGRRFIDEG